MSRRKLFGAAGVTAAVVGAAGAGALAGRASAASTTFGGLDQPVPFRGERQAGIITPQQDRMHFAAFDVTTDKRGEVIALLQQWTGMSERIPRAMMRCRMALPGVIRMRRRMIRVRRWGSRVWLTMTIGFGPSFFEKDSKDRFGIADQRPAGLADLPKFTNEILDPARCDGDICVQACAHDPQVAVHAIRNLARVGFGPSQCATRNWGSVARPRRRVNSRLPETCSGSRTKPTTSRPRTPRRWKERLGRGR